MTWALSHGTDAFVDVSERSRTTSTTESAERARTRYVVTMAHAELISFLSHVVEAEGLAYATSVFGEHRDDGTWCAWIEFQPLTGDGRALKTGRETTQPDREALELWAESLGPAYLENALDRARGAALSRDAVH